MFDGDLFDEDGALSSEYLAARGYCCGNGCRNCPYLPRHGGPDVTTLDPGRFTDRPPKHSWSSEQVPD